MIAPELLIDLLRSHWILAILLMGGMAFTHRLFRVPDTLRDMPRVPTLPLLWSYISGEVENSRIQRLLLPLADKQNQGVVLVWALGRWLIHVLDPKLAREVLENPDRFPKEAPPDDLLLWKFIGQSNILLQNGELWRKHSNIVRSALAQSLPISRFALLAKRVFTKMGAGGIIPWDELSQQFTLDAVGSTALGYDFDALGGESPFVREYNGVMHDLAHPLYLIFPSLERWFPRYRVIRKMESLVDRFQTLLQEKKADAGDDMMTFMLKQPDMSDTELRDNMVVLFIAGHDTSAGALSSLVYYFARHPECQTKARQEVLAVLREEEEPSVSLLQDMPYLSACIREALRINTPISYIVPRVSHSPVCLGSYIIPENTSIICDIYAIHHKQSIWERPSCFIPERFLNTSRATEEAWMPFASGPRQCPARNFAMYELRTVGAMILRYYEWKLPTGSRHATGIKNAFSPFALSLPHHLDIQFKARAEIPQR